MTRNRGRRGRLSEITAAAAAAAAPAAGSPPPLTLEQATAIIDGALTIQGHEAYLNSRLAAQAGRADVALFFVSDSTELRAAVKVRYPDAIFTETRPVHVGNDQSDVVVGEVHRVGLAATGLSEAAALGDALVDWWLLARADLRYGPTISGYMRTAIIHSATGAFDFGELCLDEQSCCISTGHADIGRCWIPTGSGT